ncbi:hypothetical protein KUTeg_025051, partial [Tegillarca granosa]
MNDESRRETIDLSEIVCFKCRQKGHFKRECPNNDTLNQVTSENKQQSILPENTQRVGLKAGDSTQGDVNRVGRPQIRLLAITPSCWFAKVNIGNIQIKMLVDTGSSVTVLSKDLFDKLEGGHLELCNVTSRLVTADGGPLK